MVPDHAAVEAQLDVILRSPAFAASPRMQALLRHLVTATLAGEGERLKGYAIGVDVFERDESFDPQTDSIVRVQTGRLRQLLNRYYHEDGAQDPVRIAIPKGGYAAVFSANAPAAPTLTRGMRFVRARGAIIAGAAALLAAAAVITGLLTGPAIDRATARPTGPVVQIARYRTMEASEVADRLSDGLQFELIDRLARFPNLWVLSVESDEAAGPNAAPDAPSDNAVRADFTLRGSIQIVEDVVRVTSQLEQTSTGAVVWSESSNADLSSAAGILTIQSDIASHVAAQLGQPYGVVQRRMRAEIANSADVGLDDYLCFLKYYEYSSAKTRAGHAEVRACLEDVVARIPQYSTAWAALSWMYGDEERYGFNLRADAAPPFERARDAAERAVRANPTNAAGHEYLALALFYLYDDAGFHASADRALALNPNDSDVLADIGWCLVALDNSERGAELVRKAIALNPGHPPWYHGGLAIYALQNDDAAEAIAHATANARDSGALSGMLLAGAHRLNGDAAQAKAVLAGLETDYPDAMRAPDAFLRTWRVPDKVAGLILGRDDARGV